MESRPPDTAMTRGAPRADSARAASATRAAASDAPGGDGCDRLGLPLATMSRYISRSYSRAEECCGDTRTARSDLGRRRPDRILHRADLDQLPAGPVPHPAVHHSAHLAPGQDEGAQGAKGAEALIGAPTWYPCSPTAIAPVGAFFFRGQESGVRDQGVSGPRLQERTARAS